MNTEEQQSAIVSAPKELITAETARSTQEVQAALVIAKKFPRDEVECITRIMQACQRKELAEVAEYEYSRGGTKITGPSIDLLRAIASRWGNIRHGWAELSRQKGESLVRCFAWDTQSNTMAERSITVRHWRDTKQGGYELTDERDIYELLANQAARRVRACLEEVIDSDVVTKAVETCRHTLTHGEKTPLKDRAVQMVQAFSEFAITQAMIETRLGNKLEAVSENQLAGLRRIFKSLKDGVGRREDFFQTIPDAKLGAEPAEKPKSESVTERAQKEKEAATPKPSGEPDAKGLIAAIVKQGRALNMSKAFITARLIELKYLSGEETLEELDSKRAAAILDAWDEIAKGQ